MSGADWASVAAYILVNAVSLGLTFWFMAWVMGFVARSMGVLGNPVLTRHQTTARVLLKRLWCNHTNVIRGRDGYGRTFTACARCAKDVNEGKEKWEWR